MQRHSISSKEGKKTNNKYEKFDYDTDIVCEKYSILTLKLRNIFRTLLCEITFVVYSSIQVRECDDAQTLFGHKSSQSLRTSALTKIIFNYLLFFKEISKPCRKSNGDFFTVRLRIFIKLWELFTCTVVSGYILWGSKDRIGSHKIK